jgi:type III pantothenate kinase
MIAVDIGNSGLRAAKFPDSLDATSDFPAELEVFQLSWSTIGQRIRKAKPRTIESAHERCSELGDVEALRWVVRSLAGGKQNSWRIASVQREVQKLLNEVLAGEIPSATICNVTYRDLPMIVDVEHPERVGIDRLLAARAARHLLRWRSKSREPSIVVQAGTALTVDWVDDQDRFQGGAILPGVGLSLQYMAAGTDQLPWLPSHSVHDVPPLPGKNTEQAIAAGVHAAVVGGATYLIERYRRGAPIPVVISGGDGLLLRESVEPPVYFQKHLVLMGLSLPLANEA